MGLKTQGEHTQRTQKQPIKCAVSSSKPNPCNNHRRNHIHHFIYIRITYDNVVHDAFIGIATL